MRYTIKSGPLFLICLTLTCFFLFFQAHAQNDKESSGRHLNNKVRIFGQSFMYDSAAIYSKLAADAYKREGDFEWQANATFGQGFFLSKLGRYDEAIEVVQSILNLGDTIHDYIKSRGYRTMGSIEMDRGDLDKAEDYMVEACDLSIAGDTMRYLQLKTMGHHYLGMVLDYKSLYVSAINQYEIAMGYYEDMLPELNDNELFTIYNLGLTLGRIGLTNRSKETLLKAGKMINERMENPGALMSYVYLGLARRYSDLGLTQQATDYFEKALLERKKSNPDNPNINFILLGLINNMMAAERWDEALENIEKAIENSYKIKAVHQQLRPQSYNALGNYYRKQGQPEEALVQYYKAMEEFEVAPNLTNQCATMSNIGLTLAELNRHGEGISVLKESLELLKSEEEGSTERYIENVFTLANLFVEMDESDSALFYLNKGIQKSMDGHSQLSGSSKGSVLDNLLDYVMVEMLVAKASTLKTIYDRDGRQNGLKESLYAALQADSVFNKIKSESIFIQDAISLRALISDVNTIGINVSAKLFELTQEQKYFNTAWRFSENNKANLILGQLQVDQRTNKLSVPDSIIGQVQDLNSQISYLESMLFSWEEDTATIKDNRKADYEGFLLESKEELAQLNDFIKAEYPNYHQLKFQSDYVSPAKLQKQFLRRNDLFVAYHWGRDFLYVFEIDKSSQKLRKIALDGLSDDILDFLKQMESPTSTVEAYMKANDKLFSKLFPDEHVLEQAKNLIIVPDNTLSLIPFGPLVPQQQDINDKTIFADLNYLLKTHQVSYGSSATALVKQSVTSDNRPVKVIGLAPFFEGMSADLMQDEEVARAKASPLSWSKHELDNIANHFEVDQYVGDDAAKSDVTKNASDYSVIHIASHGLINDKNPLFSRILFNTADTSTVTDGFLNAIEVYSLRFPAEMVVLSACFSGAGVEASGEGIISMASSFFYSGSKNVIMTLWQANDQSTSDLMGDFYTHLAKGKSKNNALRMAKLDYLSNADNLRSHPYYWAHFISSGNQNPLINRGIPGFVWGLALLMLLIIFVWFSKRKTTTA